MKIVAFEANKRGCIKMKYQYKTKGVCSRAMEVEIDDNGIITNATIIGGCQGNTTGVAALVKGYKATEAISRLKGIQYGARGTSCPDQLATCLEQALAASKA